MRKLFTLIVVLNVSIFNSFSQTKTLKGRVISNDIETMPGIFIMINDTVKVGTTDMSGYFKIDVPISANKILLTYVGMDPTIIELTDDCEKIEVVMMLSSSDCFMTFKRAERQRKKRYKSLAELHKQAFEKGLFETEYACFNREYYYH